MKVNRPIGFKLAELMIVMISEHLQFVFIGQKKFKQNNILHIIQFYTVAYLGEGHLVRKNKP